MFADHSPSLQYLGQWVKRKSAMISGKVLWPDINVSCLLQIFIVVIKRDHMQIIHATDNWGCFSSPLVIHTYIISM